MTRNTRLAIGLCCIAIAPLLALLYRAPAEEETTRGCMGVLGSGMNLTADFTGVFLAAVPLLLGMAFVISCFFGSDGDATV